ncbi:hypothetical protein LOK49_LG11G02786 [Camellia lanceoleosa]|uniref:Uncharacterized protein n=1 Tax=Camellia lanceoleosa TaxID=1840588 RepID=A0ACC0G1R9_9ERIC|nr:hypothetical protein LOK49_LG11G02786 [Camellia lanceoleosa]
MSQIYFCQYFLSPLYVFFLSLFEAKNHSNSTSHPRSLSANLSYFRSLSPLLSGSLSPQISIISVIPLTSDRSLIDDEGRRMRTNDNEQRQTTWNLRVIRNIVITSNS